MVFAVHLTSSTYQWRGPQHPSKAWCCFLAGFAGPFAVSINVMLLSCKDVHNRSNVSYAFLNFISPTEAARLAVTSPRACLHASYQAENFRNEFHGRQFRGVRSRKAGLPGLLAKAGDRWEPDGTNANCHWMPVCPSDSKMLSDLPGLVQETAF